MQIETDRLTLRLFRETDLDAYAEMCADPVVMRFLAQGRPASRAESWRHMAMVLGHWTLRGYGMWAVEERSSGEMVGRVGCWMPEGWPGLEIGWTLRRGFWGRGFATEAARASLRYAFDTLGADKVVHLIDPDNAASIRLAERLGAYRDGYFNIFDTRVLVYRVDRTLRATAPDMSPRREEG